LSYNNSIEAASDLDNYVGAGSLGTSFYESASEYLPSCDINVEYIASPKFKIEMKKTDDILDQFNIDLRVEVSYDNYSNTISQDYENVDLNDTIQFDITYNGSEKVYPNISSVEKKNANTSDRKYLYLDSFSSDSSIIINGSSTTFNKDSSISTYPTYEEFIHDRDKRGVVKVFANGSTVDISGNFTGDLNASKYSKSEDKFDDDLTSDYIECSNSSIYNIMAYATDTYDIDVILGNK
jgi:hypothetical protein